MSLTLATAIRCTPSLVAHERLDISIENQTHDFAGAAAGHVGGNRDRAFAAALLALGGIIFDRDRHPLPLLMYLIAFFVFLGLMRLYRILWAFEKLITVLVHPEISPTASSPSESPRGKR